MTGGERRHDEARAIPVHDPSADHEARRPGSPPIASSDPGVHDDGSYTVDTRRRFRLRSDERGAVPDASARSANAVGAASRPAGNLGPAAAPDAARPDPRRPAPGIVGRPGSRVALPPDPPDDQPPLRTGTRRRRLRLVAVLLAVALVAWIAFLVVVPVRAWGGVERVDNAPAERTATGKGRNFLLVGSDSRDDLTEAQRANLATGYEQGKRTDSIMLVHVSETGKSSIVSIPRDSYVPIPGKGSNKINASFSLGGPKLLTQTVEQVTGLHVDGYLEIGFGGFASIVDSLGGVEICVATDMKDPLAGIDLKKGCQTLDGANALGYVRSRHADPRGDLGRAERQRQFLGAVMRKAATPSTVMLPWRYLSFTDAAAGGIVAGHQTSATDALSILQTLRSAGGDDVLSLQVPVENPAYPTKNAGVAVKWDTERSKALFTALREDRPLTQPPPGTTV